MVSELPSLPSTDTVIKTAETYARDLGERIAWTFALTEASILVSAGPADMFSVSFWHATGVAGIAAVGSLVKGIIARGVGVKNSASTAPGV